ncbi:MAG: DUF167 domain-containing protein [Thermodesulfobacteriota bacterium]
MSSPELAMRVVADGVRIKLRVVPGARRDAVLGPHGDALRVAVRAVPEKGRANEAVERLLATVLGVAPADVELVAGTSGRDKVLQIRGLEPAVLRERLLGAHGAGR